MTKREWTRTLIAIYGPTLLASVGFGATIPLVALQATDLGASVGLAALITALRGIAQAVGDLPAGVIADRLGEKYAIVLACLIDAVTMACVFMSHSLLILAAAVLLQGLTASVFGLARQTYLTVRIPLQWRARAMSSLGGVFRIGWFIGPLMSAAIIHRWSLTAAFGFAGLMSLTAAVATLSMPDLPGEVSGLAGIRQRQQADHPATWTILRQHRKVLLTVAMGCLGLMLIRSVRQIIIPLWAESHGISASTTSLIYSASMAFDVLLFFPGGAIMDRFGRWWVTVPAIFTMSNCLLILPLTSTTATITAVACLLGLGNGVSSGIVITLGSDFSPEFGRAQFLAGWRLIADSGNAIGPMIVSAVAHLAGLSVSALTLGVIGLVATGWLARFVPRNGQLPDSS